MNQTFSSVHARIIWMTTFLYELILAFSYGFTLVDLFISEPQGIGEAGVLGVFGILTFLGVGGLHCFTIYLFLKRERFAAVALFASGAVSVGGIQVFIEKVTNKDLGMSSPGVFAIILPLYILPIWYYIVMRAQPKQTVPKIKQFNDRSNKNTTG